MHAVDNPCANERERERERGREEEGGRKREFVASHTRCVDSLVHL